MGHARWYQDILDENLRLRIENDAVKDENRLLKARVALLYDDPAEVLAEALTRRSAHAAKRHPITDRLRPITFRA